VAIPWASDWTAVTWTAVGTVAVAVTSALGIGAALYIAWADRHKADQRAQDDRQHNADLAQADRDHRSHTEDQERMIARLVRLGELHGVAQTNEHLKSQAATSNVQLLLHLVPPDFATALRYHYEVGKTPEIVADVVARIEPAYRMGWHGTMPMEVVLPELSANISTVMANADGTGWRPRAAG
jgi:hypothetical protein